MFRLSLDVSFDGNRRGIAGPQNSYSSRPRSQNSKDLWAMQAGSGLQNQGDHQTQGLSAIVLQFLVAECKMGCSLSPATVSAEPTVPSAPGDDSPVARPAERRLPTFLVRRYIEYVVPGICKLPDEPAAPHCAATGGGGCEIAQSS
jgi:hypothetical protein